MMTEHLHRHEAESLGSAVEAAEVSTDYNVMREELINLKASQRLLNSRVNSDEAQKALALNLVVQKILDNNWNLDWEDKADDVFSENKDGETVFDLNWSWSDVAALNEQDWADIGLTSEEGLNVLRSAIPTIQETVQNLKHAEALKDQAGSIVLGQKQLAQVEAQIAALEPALRFEATTDYTWLADKFEATRAERQQRYTAAGLRDFEIESIEKSIATVIRPNTVESDDDDLNYGSNHLAAGVATGALETYEGIMRELFGFQDYPLPQASELTPEKIAEYDRVELVVHPLFAMLATDGLAGTGRLTKEEWESSGQNLDAYIEGKILTLANTVQAKLQQSPEQMPLEYAILLELQEEYEKITHVPPDTLRIYINSSPFELKPERQQAYHQFFQGQAGNGNVYQVYSESYDRGHLRETDRVTLEMIADNLKDSASVVASGGYLEDCLAMAYDAEDYRQGRYTKNPTFDTLFGSRLELDYRGSTSVSVITSNYRPIDEDTGERIEMQDGIALRELAQGLPPINQQNGLQTLEDVFAYLNSNQAFNAEWKTQLEGYHHNKFWEN